MKNIIVLISRILVGSILIVSGVIKANDTLGFSYKLVDYFTDGVLGMEFLQPYTVFMAGFICILEIVLGVALIFGLRAKFVTFTNLLMMLFFTFLTFYSAYFNKVTDCGCFGDALKLTPWESFYKDVFLMVFSTILFTAKAGITKNTAKEDLLYIPLSLLVIALFSVGVTGWWFPVFFSIIVFVLIFVFKKFDRSATRLLLVPFIASFIFIRYTLDHLPIHDFRAYAVGKNINEGMLPDPNALPELVEHTWTFDVNGKTVTKVTEGAYPDVPNGVYKDVVTKVIRAAAEPPIHDFTIENSSGDHLEEMMAMDKLLFVVAYDFDKSDIEGLQEIKNFVKQAEAQGYKVVGLTAESIESSSQLNKLYDLAIDWYFCDSIPLKTMVRANPGIVSLSKAVVKQKLHWNDLNSIKW